MDPANERIEAGRTSEAPEKEPYLGNLETRQRQLLQGLLRAGAIVGLLVALAGTYDSYQSGDLWTLPLYWVSYGLVLLLLVWKSVPFALQAWILTGIIYLQGVVDLASDGLSGSARAYLLTVPFLAAVFLGRRASIVALTLSSLTMALFGWAYSIGILWIPDDSVVTDPASWIVGTLSLFLLGTLMVVSLEYLLPRLDAALDRSQKLAEELQAQRDQLEHAVETRTAELVRRSAQLETAAQIAGEATVIQDVRELLDETVQLISSRFGFYHTGIFLVDEFKRYAVLRAASSEGGQRMLARGHRLRVGEVGLVGHATGQGVPRIALDVGSDAAYFDNPDLPETRSEIVLPLRARGEVIGALDVQSTEPEAFADDDISVLQTLADQVAIALSNATLFQQVEESLEAERQAYGELSREAWRRLLRTRAGLGQRYDPQGILPEAGGWRQEMELAIDRAEAVASDSGPTPALAIPIMVRGEVIGVVDAHKDADSTAWTPEQVELMQTMVDQIGLALESARLHQDAQQRATHEQVMGEVAARMRETLDLDTVLQTAIREIGEALGIAEVEVRMGEGRAQGPLDLAATTLAEGGGNGDQGDEGGSS